MKLTIQKWLYGSAIVLSLGVLLSVLYYQMGGFEEVKAYQLNPINRTIAGKYFYTTYTDPELQHHFDKCVELVLKGDIDGTVTTVDYLPDTLKENMRMQFIGVSLNSDMAEIPSGFEVRHFESKERFAVFLSMHPFVRPRIPTLESMLRVEAVRAGFELSDVYFRLRYPDNSISVEGWVE